MARETIFCSTPPQKLSENGGPEFLDERHVPQVIWQRDQFVQLGVVPELSPDAHQVGDRLFTGELDRAQINSLIRILKRARDSAYGADE